MKQKSLYTLLISLLLLFPAFSTDFSPAEENLISEILDFRFNLRTFDSADACLDQFPSYEKSVYESETYKNASEEFSITVQNLLKTAKYNCLYEKNLKDPQLKDLMVGQYEKILAYNKNVDAQNRNKWYNVTSADIINSTMQFLPQSQAIKLGLEEKSIYDSMMETYPDFSYLFINSGLWYMFAPAIGGGSDQKALGFFQTALENAHSNYEKYYAAIYYSQLLFEKNKKDQCNALLAQAENLLPGKRYVKLIKLLNENDYSVFYYTNNREKVDKKLGL